MFGFFSENVNVDQYQNSLKSRDWLDCEFKSENVGLDWLPDTPPSDEKKSIHENKNEDIKFPTILRNSFGVHEYWVPEPVPEKRIADCDKKCLEKVKRMAEEDKCKSGSQSLRKSYLKKPVINMRLEAPIPDPQETR